MTIEAKREYMRRYRTENLELVRAKDRLRARATKEARAEYFRQWREHNKEALADSKRRYAIKNREATRRRFQRWAAANPDRVKDSARRRKATLAGVPSEPYTSTEIFERDNWTCQLCLLPLNPEANWPNHQFSSIDHVVPISRGGPDTPGNVQAAHLGCNLAKGARM